MTELTTENSISLTEIQHHLREGTLSSGNALSAATRAAAEFLMRWRNEETYFREAVTLLCELATHQDIWLARAGITGLFPHLVEKLNDSFEPDSSELYDRVFAQAIEFCRHLPESAELNQRLRDFNLTSDQDLLERKRRLESASVNSMLADRRATIKQVILLSRVTLGADVVVTSVILSALRQALPQAKLMLLGSAKLRQLFGGDERITVREVAYERSGTLTDRLNAWLEVVRIIEDESKAVKADELLVIDPDSRMTQLGLLPVRKDDQGYLFFNSRSWQQPERERLSQLTESWVNQLLQTNQPALPFVALPEQYRINGQRLVRRLRQNDATHVVSVSFGVGGNQRKQMPDPFEAELLTGLLKDSKLIVDKGGNQAERQQINRLLEQLRVLGKNVIEADEENFAQLRAEQFVEADVLTWDGSIGAFAGLIAASDEYLGYDSAGQHIAAAQGVPTQTVFVNSGTDRFAKRWHPHGSGVIRVLRIDRDENNALSKRTDEVLDEVLTTHQQIRQQLR